MMALIKKDYAFNLQRVAISLAIALLFPACVRFDKTVEFVSIIYLVGPFLAMNIFVSHACYIDDGIKTRMFLMSLPFKQSAKVASKYTLCVVHSVLCIGLTVAGMLVLGYSVTVNDIALALAIELFYYAVFFYLFYRFTYSASQSTFMVYMVTVAIITVTSRSIGFQMDTQFLSLNYAIIALGLSILVYASSLLIAVRRNL